ncbi:hypothetical protein LTR17_018128 [Elasticomyces elasticus]|nr:hypothetical protein LTR17_018128 [Elasticomyces elasticus]
MHTFHHHFPTCPHIAGSIDFFSIHRILGTGALWEEMYITNPPIKTVEQSYGADNTRIMRRKAGIKFKDLVKEICVLAKSSQKSHKNASASDESTKFVVFAGPIDEKRYSKYKATKPVVNTHLSSQYWDTELLDLQSMDERPRSPAQGSSAGAAESVERCRLVRSLNAMVDMEEA